MAFVEYGAHILKYLFCYFLENIVSSSDRKFYPSSNVYRIKLKTCILKFCLSSNQQGALFLVN